MPKQALSLMDVLAPPVNRWLVEISRNKAELPAGVHIVRFGEGDDDLAEDGEDVGAKAEPRTTATA